jgi:hypothetical protein
MGGRLLWAATSTAYAVIRGVGQGWGLGVTGQSGESWAATVHGEWFCANPQCVLHVRVGGPAVRGSGGEWAVRPDAVVTSRAMYAGRMLCDICGRSKGRMKSGGES